jgi:hypothetical protein
LIVLFLYTSIAQTCRVGKAISKWHVCHTLWHLGRQWRGDS